MGTVEDVRKVFKDLVAPDLRALTVRLDVLEKRIDERFSGIEKRIDGVEERLDERIAGVEKHLDARIDGVEKHLDERITGVEKRFDARIDDFQKNVDTRFNSLDVSIKVLAETMKENQTQIMSQISTLVSLQVISERLNKLEAKVEPQAH